MKNENKTDEMVDILSHLHHYDPMVEVPSQAEIATEKLHHLVLGGDQLTAERVWGAQNI